jgi:hypothetical protein
LYHAFYLTSTLEICETWGVGEAPISENEPVYSDIPTLVLVGEYDPITPPASGRMAAETLEKGFYFQFPGLGHGTVDADCPASIALAFLGDPVTKPDFSCIEEMSNPRFVTADELYLTPAPYRLLTAFLSGGSLWPVAVSGFCGLFLLIMGSVILWALVSLLTKKRSPTLRREWLIHGLLFVIASINLFFVISLVVSISLTMLNDWSTLVFGLPRGAAWLFLLPPLSTLLTIELFAVTVLAWGRRDWSVVRRLLYSLATTLLGAFAWFLAYWDMLRLRF